MEEITQAPPNVSRQYGRQAQKREPRETERPRRPQSRAFRYMVLGVTCIIPGLVLYFGGGFLFVASYNRIYPIAGAEVGPFEARIYWYMGPVLFFVGLFIFVFAYAMICKGVDNMGS